MRRSLGLARVLLAATLVAGCRRRPIPEQAHVGTTAIGGRVMLTSGATTDSIRTFGDAAFIPEGPSSTAPDCSVNLGGTATADHTGTVQVDVSCAVTVPSGPTSQQRLRIVLPDLRPLSARDVVSVDVYEDYATDDGDVDFDCGGKAGVQASLSIDEASSSESPAPAYVGAGFLRVARIELDAASTQLGTDDRQVSCGQPFDHLSLRASFRLVASDYTQDYEFSDGLF